MKLPIAYIILWALCIPVSMGQGYGYVNASPNAYNEATMTVAGTLSGNLNNPTVTYEASTSRDSIGVASGSILFFEFDERHVKRAGVNSKAEVTRVCTDYNVGGSSCTNAWINVSPSISGQSFTFPSISAGADVSERVMAIRVAVSKYNESGQLLGSGQSIVTTRYFLVPPADHFYRDPAGNEVAIWRQRAISGSNTLLKPLIIAEGIDISDSSDPASYFGQLGSLADVLRNAGHDIAVVSFGQPLSSIRVHEGGFRNAIQLVHQMKGDPMQGTAVLGISRGGVVARYALAKMEETQTPHHVSVFFSYDSPQRGANINRHLINIIEERLSGDPEGQVLVDQLKSDAVRELLQDHPDNDASNDMHASFYQELDQLNGGAGYPLIPRKVAWSNGVWQSPQFSSNVYIIIDAATSGYDIQLNLTLSDTQPGSTLPPSFGKIIDGREGNADLDILEAAFVYVLGPYLITPASFFTQSYGSFYRLALINEPTFIPTASALDKDGPSASTPFDRAEHAEWRRSHAAVPDKAVRLILEELGLLPSSADLHFGPSQTIATPFQIQPYQRVFVAGEVVFSSDVTIGKGAKVFLDTSPGSESRVYFDGRVEARGTSEYPIIFQRSGTDPGLRNQTWVYGDGSVFEHVEFSGSSEALAPDHEATDHLRSLQAAWMTGEGSAEGGRAATLTAVSAATGRAAGDAGAFGASSVAGEDIVDVLELGAPYPNPTSADVAVPLALPVQAAVRVTVYDVLGRHVALLHDGPLDAGRHRLTLDAHGLPSGTYAVRAEVAAGDGAPSVLHRRLSVVR